MYNDLNPSYNFSHNTNPSLKLGVSGNPQPTVKFTFDRKTTQAVGISLQKFQQYEFDLKLPQLKGKHCGTVLSYTATSILQNSVAVNGSTTINVDGKINFTLYDDIIKYFPKEKYMLRRGLLFF